MVKRHDRSWVGAWVVNYSGAELHCAQSPKSVSPLKSLRKIRVSEISEQVTAWHGLRLPSY